MTALSARCKITYPGFDLDAEIDIDLRGITAIFGPSGSGKTTLLRAIAGLERPRAARIVLDNDVWHDTLLGVFVPPWRRNIGYVFQDARLFPHLSVAGNIAYGQRRTPPERRRFESHHVSDVMGLRDLLGRRTGGLSGGERQRVAIARAVLASPRLLLMDEPVSALDAEAKEEILPFIQRVGEAFGIPILYVSHAIDEVIRLAAQMIVIEEGKVLAAGPLTEVSNRLDLRALISRLDAGSVIATVVARHDPGNGLTRLKFAGGQLVAPLMDVPVGTAINLRIRARDVALALTPPNETSILNILAGRVVEISTDDGPHAHVLLDIGCPLWARIMRKSIGDLGLAPGREVYALLKAVAVDQRSLGRPTSMDRAISRSE